MQQNLGDIQTKNKLNKHYAVKGIESKAIEGVDLEKRTVKGVLNTSYWIDKDGDMIIKGAVAKSLADNGPDSDANVKIKHQIDHSMRAENTIGKFITLKERKKDNLNQLYFESFLPETQQSTDHLIKYQSGLYDQHSIGFQYLDLIRVEKESSDELSREMWKKYYPLALNPEVADKYGYFWVVKTYKLFEGSVVTFGSNELTPYLGSKSTDKSTYIIDLFNRLDFLQDLSKNKEHKEFRIEILQIKQIIQETFEKQPLLKATLITKPEEKTDTEKTNEMLSKLLKIYK